MHLDCFKEVKQLTEMLVRVPSIVKTSGETDCAKTIYEWYAELPYFKENPEKLQLVQTIDDEIERYIVLAQVEGTKGDSKKAVIMMGHLDTVEIDDFGYYKKYAFNPDILPSKLKKLNISEEVNEDIASGEYMFGRGVLDMKSGIAGHMYLIKYFSEHREELNGHLISLATCDEEDNSNGVITALKVLREMKEKDGLGYIAAINADYSTPYHEKDDNLYVYFGTVGKLLPTFFCTGRETHVGQVFGGLDPNLLVAELTRLISLNPDLCDEAHGEVTNPPISLKQSDLKEKYSVQTATAAYSYYNFFKYSMSPKDVMDKLKPVAEEAFTNVIEYVNKCRKKFCKMANCTYTKLPWHKRVYTWEEFYNELVAIRGEKFKTSILSFAKELDEKHPDMDLREFSVRIVEKAWEWAVDKSPAIIIFFSSTYFARIEVTGETEKEKTLLDSIKESIALLQNEVENTIVTKMFYPYISDISFMNLSDDIPSIKALEMNMPAWGTRYLHNIENILSISVPVVTIGTYGKDGHMMTERVHMRHSFETTPNLAYLTIKKLLK